MQSDPAEASLPVPLASVISTQELILRPVRPPDYEGLSRALITLAQTLAGSPGDLLQQLVEKALELCAAQSAGISLLEEENGQKIFRWHAVAGKYAAHLWETTPREFSPCGTVLDTDAVQLMSHIHRHFTYFTPVEPHVAEVLLIPFHVGGKAVGTIWIVFHDQNRQFDAEDARVITTLGEFAATAYHALSGTRVLKSIFATVRDPLLVLDRSLRIQTVSQSFYQTFHVTPSATEGRHLYQVGNGEWDIPKLRALLEDILPNNSAFDNFSVEREFPSLGRRVMLLNARKLVREETPDGLILLAIEDITDRKSEEEAIHFREDSQVQTDRLRNINDEIAKVKRNFEEFIGSSTAMERVMRQVEVVAPTDATVLILGETGTGKELIARALHRLSPRSKAPFVTLNCAAIPTGLLESELFGYEKGAFTGALTQKLGRFELAHGGTLFLDELGDIPLDLQPKLLRALQEKTFERLGGTKTIPIDVRLVAATNRNLTRMMRDKAFRSDLYYRLMVFPIITPPLRDHPEDIPILTEHFIRKYGARMKRTIDRIPSATMKALVRWPWPGNVRELENFIEHSVILSRGPSLRAPISELGAGSPETDGDSSIEDAERDRILKAFRATGGVISATANHLGIPRTTLNARMKKLGISRRDL